MGQVEPLIGFQLPPPSGGGALFATSTVVPVVGTTSGTAVRTGGIGTGVAIGGKIATERGGPAFEPLERAIENGEVDGRTNDRIAAAEAHKDRGGRRHATRARGRGPETQRRAQRGGERAEGHAAPAHETNARPGFEPRCYA